jgi:hypothetical protein
MCHRWSNDPAEEQREDPNPEGWTETTVKHGGQQCSVLHATVEIRNDLVA